MAQAPVTELRFDRVPQGVAEVEQPAAVALFQVRFDDVQLGLDRRRDDRRQRVRVAREQPLERLLRPIQQLEIKQRRHLDHLEQPGPQFADRQRAQAVDVGKHKARMVEGADRVLAAGQVDPGLAADRGVDLGQQRGRNLDVVDAAQEAGGDEASQIAHRTAAEGHHPTVTLAAALEHLPPDRGGGLDRLRRLAVGHLDRLDPGRAGSLEQVPCRGAAVTIGHLARKQEHDPAPAPRRHATERALGARGQQTRADEDLAHAPRMGESQTVRLVRAVPRHGGLTLRPEGACVAPGRATAPGRPSKAPRSSGTTPTPSSGRRSRRAANRPRPSA